jgi:hypothetical protein
MRSISGNLPPIGFLASNHEDVGLAVPPVPGQTRSSLGSLAIVSTLKLVTITGVATYRSFH